MIRHLAIAGVLGLSVYVAGDSINPLFVVDGDTVRVETTRYRLYNIDAPELAKPRCLREETLAVLAKQRLYELTRGEFQLRHVACWHKTERNPRDRFDRTCIELRVATPEGWQDAGEILIAEKLAVRFGRGRPDWCAK